MDDERPLLYELLHGDAIHLDRLIDMHVIFDGILIDLQDEIDNIYPDREILAKQIDVTTFQLEKWLTAEEDIPAAYLFLIENFLKASRTKEETSSYIKVRLPQPW